MSGLATGWTYLTSWFRREGNADGNTQLARQVAPRDRAIAQLQGAYEEVVGLMTSMQQHMQAQNDRSERLLQMMEGLPEALKSLPEAQRNQTRTLEAIQGHLAEQSRNTAGLTQAITSLAQAADNHERSMNIIQQQLDASQHNGEQILSSFSSLSDTLGRMTDSSQAGTAVLQRLADRGEQSDQQMRQLFSRSQRQFTIMSAISWALAILALGVAGLVAFAVTQQSLAATPATPTAPAIDSPSLQEGLGEGAPALAATIPAVTAPDVEPVPEAATPLTGVPPIDAPPAAAPIDPAELMARPILGRLTFADLLHIRAGDEADAD
ncbi:MAG: hypothetical protein WD009_09585 [Phycisphaeraceae bacterium]